MQYIFLAFFTKFCFTAGSFSQTRLLTAGTGMKKLKNCNEGFSTCVKLYLKYFVYHEHKQFSEVNAADEYVFVNLNNFYVIGPIRL